MRLGTREGIHTRVRRGVGLKRLHHHRRLSWGVRHSALLGQRVARCHDVTDARAVALDIVIHEVVKRGRSIVRESI